MRKPALPCPAERAPVSSVNLLRFTVVTYERLPISKISFTDVFYTYFRCNL